MDITPEQKAKLKKVLKARGAVNWTQRVAEASFQRYLADRQIEQQARELYGAAVMAFDRPDKTRTLADYLESL
jgi:hypothetical protein